MNKPELLLPAGSLSNLKTAFLYGADVVYCGTPTMSLRARSKMTLEDVIEGIKYAHSVNKKVYLTMNLIAHNSDIEKLPEYVEALKTTNPDGVIVADPAIFEYVRKELPMLNLHVSVQSCVTSWLGVQFWEKMGAKMCILARELGYQELKEIREKCPNIRLEMFIHGSMCMSYSGRCLLSNYFTGRDANKGKCAHSCRWNYKVRLKLKDNIKKEFLLDDNTKELFDFLLQEETRTSDLLELDEHENGATLLNSKDLCLLPRLESYIKSGVDCLKVEGRNKTQYYVGMVARTYRKAIDDYFNNPTSWKYEDYIEDLYSISNRGYSLAFADGRPTALANSYDITRSLSEWEFAGFIKDYDNDFMYIEVKNRLDAGCEMEFISPSYDKIYKIILNEFIIEKDNKVVICVSAGQEQAIKIPLSVFKGVDNIRDIMPKLTLIKIKNNKLNEEQIKRIQQDKVDFKKEISKDL
ncbi:MAG: U32 family peptidase C-terminal domain-containing protein [Rickettsiales bacterium]|jgi:putative protease|nr:U32 family peptidase C-terminal domain-containing protein [Rickettsiales bacterium]